MCVSVCAHVRVCTHVSWCVNGNQENSGISFLLPTIQVLSGELRLLGLLAGAFLRTIGQPQIHVFKMCDFLYWSIGD